MIKSKAVAALMCLVAATSFVNDAAAQSPPKPEKAKPVMCAVIEIDGVYEVILKTELAAKKKQLAQEHKDAKAEHKAAKAAAKKAKEKFTAKPPVARKMKVVKSSIEQSKADALLKKLEADAAKKAARKSGKPKSGK